MLAFLEDAWECQAGQPFEDLKGDLERLRVWFRPDLTPRAVRKAVAAVTPSSVTPPRGTPESVYLPLPGRRGLVTPEGRLLASLLVDEGDAIQSGAMLDAYAELATFYGEAYRSRLQSATRGGDVRPNTFAFVICLMLNGSVGRECALRHPSTPDDESRLARAITQVLDAFVDAIGADRLAGVQRDRMRGNWALTESAAQLPDLVAHEGDAYWIEEKGLPTLDNRLAAVLAARRSPPTPSELEIALVDARRAYVEARPAFAALGMAFDRPSQVSKQVARLVSAYGSQTLQ